MAEELGWTAAQRARFDERLLELQQRAEAAERRAAALEAQRDEGTHERCACNTLLHPLDMRN